MVPIDDSSILDTYWDNGQPKQKNQTKNGLLHGVVRAWGRSGKLTHTVTYVEGKQTGVKKKFFATGNIKSEMILRDGLIVGEAKWYRNMRPDSHLSSHKSVVVQHRLVADDGMHVTWDNLETVIKDPMNITDEEKVVLGLRFGIFKFLD